MIKKHIFLKFSINTHNTYRPPHKDHKNKTIQIKLKSRLKSLIAKYKKLSILRLILQSSNFLKTLQS